MPEYKNQHYISQLLLKKFASDTDGKLINIYNRGILKALLNKPIKPQAQEDYFYGKDGDFEKFLGISEGRVDPIINEIIYNASLPSCGTKSYSFLLHFVMLYNWRTKASVDQTGEHINQHFAEWTKNDPEFEEFRKNNYRIKHPEPAAFNLAAFMNSWVVTADLIPYLVLNYTEKEFVFSDNPLVTYNPFMQHRECYWAANSILSKGLTMIFPLSPFHTLLFIDSKFYDVKSTAQNIIPLENKDDIDLLNLLQAISADQNIYFASEHQAKYVETLSKQGQEQKQDKAVTKIIPNPEKPGSLMQLSYTIRHDIKQYFSFLRESKVAIGYQVDGVLKHPRNDEMVDWINKIVRQR